MIRKFIENIIRIIPGGEGKEAGLGRGEIGLQCSPSETSADPRGNSRAVMALKSCSKLQGGNQNFTLP